MTSPGDSEGLRGWLAQLASEFAEGLDAQAPWLFVVAHPDDETIGASWLLRRAHNLHVVHVTDGAPHDVALWSTAQPNTRRGYAALRAQEAVAAMSLVGVDASRVQCLGFVDQEASAQLAQVTRALRGLVAKLGPAVVVTQPYEGGHPDHDACAFAVQLAVPADVRRIEMTSYHAWRGEVRRGSFLGVEQEAVTCTLDEAEQALKRRMFACFASQREVLSQFPLDAERFRRAPRYDFTVAPHTGRLHYETFEGAMSGNAWRALAVTALAQLG
ncbi:MAG: PIG-L deacetylase family protein [Myxococcaceae bacterium]